MAPESATEVVLIEGLLGELGWPESNSNLAWLGVEGARRESESQAAIGSFLRSRKSSKRALRRRHRRAMDGVGAVQCPVHTGSLEASSDGYFASGFDDASDRAMIVVTHYQRLLNYIVPDYVHVLADDRIVKTGDKNLALELEQTGYTGVEEVVTA